MPSSPLTINTAMVFAAGLGTRMRPLTLTIPKPMVNIRNKPLIDYRIDYLIASGVKNIIVNTHYLHEQIEQHLAQRKDANIIISYEETLLDTAGGLAYARPHLGDAPIFVTNSDTIWIDGTLPALQRMREYWDAEKMDILLLLHPRETAFGYHGAGDFDLHTDGTIARSSNNRYVYTGVMILSPHLINNLTVAPLSLRDIMFKTLDPTTGIIDRVHGIVHDGSWLHIDSVDFIKPAEDLLNKIC